MSIDTTHIRQELVAKNHEISTIDPKDFTLKLEAVEFYQRTIPPLLDEIDRMRRIGLAAAKLIEAQQHFQNAQALHAENGLDQ